MRGTYHIQLVFGDDYGNEDLFNQIIDIRDTLSSIQKYHPFGEMPELLVKAGVMLYQENPDLLMTYITDICREDADYVQVR